MTRTNDVAMKLVDELLTCAAAAKRYGATGDDMSIALITLVANHCGHACQTEAAQDMFLQWFLSGVEATLKGAGVRSTARPNPLVPTARA